MKPLITALGICALLFASSNTYAQPYDYQWDGAHDSDWVWLDVGQTPDNNWSGMGTDNTYPGQNQADDTATIADPTPQSNCVFSDEIEETVHWVKVDATNGAMSLTLNGSADLDIDRTGDADLGYLQLIGGDADTEEATFHLDAGTFACDWIDLDGGINANREAILDIDTNFSVGDASDSVLVTGYAAVDVEASYTFTARDVEVGDGALTTLFDMRTGTGTMTATSLDIIPGNAASEHARFLLSAGTLDVNGEVDLTGAASVDADATMQVSSGATFEPNSLDLNGATNVSYGYAILDLDEDVTVGNASDSVSVTGYAEIDVANPGTAKVFYAKDMDVGDGQLATFCEKKTGTGELDATGLTITAGNSANEEATFKLSAGTLDVNGTITVDSGTASGAHARLWSTVTTLEFTDMTLDGHNSNARAILDLDESATQSSSDVTVVRAAYIDIASGKTLTIDDLLIGDNDDTGDDYNGVLTVSDGGTVSADRIVIEGESGTGSSLTVSSSTVETS